MLKTANFFALFELPVSFQIDSVALKQKFLSLQKAHHPDVVTPEQQSQAEQNASLINHAYNTLSRDDARALYLLELEGKLINADASINDPDFLGQMMAIRMDLDDAISDQDSHALAQLSTQLQSLIKALADDFAQFYQSEQWAEAALSAQKLRFLGKLSDDIHNALSNAAHNNASHDDDLYT